MKNTGLKDDIGNEIFVGNRLWCKEGYDVIVKQGEDGYYGQLVCKSNHPCANIHYSLNKGKGHIKYEIPLA
jgi:hypothetical protein